MSVIPSSSTRTRPLQRLEDLCDPGTLELLSLDREASNVIPARGECNGRAIACYAQDATIAGGSVGAAEADAIVRAIRLSREAGIPIVGLIESGGARLQEGTGALAGYGRIFYETVALSGWAPQISVITGLAAGGGCYSPALTDFVVMSGEASMFLTGPKIVRHALGEEVTIDELGGVRVHQRNGVCDFVAADDRAAVALVRELLGYLPQNTAQPMDAAAGGEPPPGIAPDAALPARRRSYYDVRDVIRALVDGGRLLEVSSQWARNVVCCLARLEGRPIGVLANQARYLGGIIDVAASQKAAKFVRTCDVFGLPLLVLVDTPGFMPGTRQESEGVIRHGADLVRSFAAARVPRVTVVVRKAFGGAFIAMNSKDLGATASFSWPDAELGVMSSGAAVEILHRRRLAADAPEGMADELAGRYAEEHLTPAAALSRGAIDAVITPEQTRARVSAALGLTAEPALHAQSVNGR